VRRLIGRSVARKHVFRHLVRIGNRRVASELDGLANFIVRLGIDRVQRLRLMAAFDQPASEPSSPPIAHMRLEGRPSPRGVQGLVVTMTAGTAPARHTAGLVMRIYSVFLSRWAGIQDDRGQVVVQEGMYGTCDIR
jgi:hypothetical protein